MVFSSITFLAYFLPIVLIAYFIVPKSWRRYKNAVLLLSSLVFYACSGVRYLLLMLAVILTDYLCGLLCGLGRTRSIKKLGVIASVVISLGLLGWFKYAGFFSENLSALGLPIPVVSIVLPVGLSFYSFQGLSYVVDVYREQAAVQKNPCKVALYVALFPQLVAGPIVRYTTIAEEIDRRQENLTDFSEGLTRFCFGLGKKMLLANAMGEIADAVYGYAAATLPAGLAWIGALAYTLQIYFDFSAYSDMAIGLGRMFGFHFLENFNYPYISKTVTEFWRRWHISLSSWFRDYLYIPLGGNRCSRLKNIRNLTIVWLLTGLWHGASWTFVVWGAWFLVFLLGEKFLWGRILEKLPAPIRWGYTMLIVIISWVFFRSSSLTNAWAFLKSMLGLGGGIQASAAIYYLLEYWPEWICALIACMPVKQWLQSALERKGTPLCQALLIWGPKVLALILLLASYMKLVTGSFNPFIYFQF